MQKCSSKIIKILPTLLIIAITIIVLSAIIVTVIINVNDRFNQNTTNEFNNENILNENILNENILNENITNELTIEQTEKETEDNEEENNTQETNEDENIDTNNEEETNITSEKEETSINPNTNSSQITQEEDNTKSEPVVEEEEEEEEEEESFSFSTSELLSEASQLKSQYNSLIQKVQKYTNEYRDEANEDEVNDISNRSNLVLDSSLTTAACVRAIEIAKGDEFSHTRPNGTSCFTVLTDMGISSSARAENIAECYSAESAASGWKNSAGHYKNMINPSFKKVGIGVIKYNGTYTWVQLFTN